jgi:hypothetical protein
MVKSSTLPRQVIITFVMVLSSLGSVAQQLAYESPAGTKFLLYTPPGYASSSTTYPLLLSLHSKGEVGDDLSELTSRNPEQMPSRLIYLNKWPQHLPFIVLTPQLKPDTSDPDREWPAKYVDEVVAYVLANFRVDQSRIYVTGISRGGTGTWIYASAYPQRVAAMVPISGKTDLTQACRLKNIPIWAFNGDGDRVVTQQYSIEMVEAINACQPAGAYKPYLTILNARDHNGWNEVYNGTSGYEIYDWLLMFRKNDTSNKRPYVKAGPDLRIQVRSEPLHITSDIFDSDGTITNITWRQTSGTPLTLQNTNTPMLRVSNLTPGIFRFQVTATDNRGGQNTDTVQVEITGTNVVPAVTQLVLYDGRTNASLGNLTEGQVIDMAALGLTEINVNAIVTSGTASLKFTINNAVTRSQNGGPYFIKLPGSGPEWKVNNGVYLICATPYPNVYSGGIPGLSLCFKITVINRPSDFCPGTGTVRQEFWTGISGTQIASVPFHSPPSFVNDLLLFEGPTTSIADNYGSRIRGWVCPPASGNYTFWIAADDKAELWLSTSDQPAEKVLIASTPGATSRRQWGKFPSQRSALIRLNANQRYYIEALHKEAFGADHISVGWESPTGALERPIPRFRFIPVDGSQPPVIDITNPTGGETFSAPATINLTANASDPDGSISAVDFYNGTVKLGQDATPPYQFSWTDVSAGSYTIVMKAIANDGATATASVNVVVTDGGTCEGNGRISYEKWTNVSGTTVSSIPLTQTPNTSSELTIFEAPMSAGDQYGARIRGYICAPLSGAYTFWISGDDHTELWLSTDDNPANKRLIAYERGWTSVRQWTKYASQQSAPITLSSGRRYYIEALHKEASGGDHVAVGWQLPNGVFERPIPGMRLAPFGQSFALFENVTHANSNTIGMERNIDVGLDVFPNPAQHGVSRLTITTNEAQSSAEKVVLRIVRLTGEVIHTSEIDLGSALSVDEGIPSGIYLVEVNVKGKRYSKRLLVR